MSYLRPQRPYISFFLFGLVWLGGVGWVEWSGMGLSGVGWDGGEGGGWGWGGFWFWFKCVSTVYNDRAIPL